MRDGGGEDPCRNDHETSAHRHLPPRAALLGTAQGRREAYDQSGFRGRATPPRAPRWGSPRHSGWRRVGPEMAADVIQGDCAGALSEGEQLEAPGVNGDRSGGRRRRPVYHAVLRIEPLTANGTAVFLPFQLGQKRVRLRRPAPWSGERAVSSMLQAEESVFLGGRIAALALPAPAAGEALVGLVDEQPLAMLKRLALAGRKGRQSFLLAWSHTIAGAVLRDAGLEVFGRESGPASCGHETQSNGRTYFCQPIGTYIISIIGSRMGTLTALRNRVNGSARDAPRFSGRTLRSTTTELG